MANPDQVRFLFRKKYGIPEEEPSIWIFMEVFGFFQGIKKYLRYKKGIK